MSSVTDAAKQFQLFQPIAGVRPICAPHTIFNFPCALPSAFVAFTLTSYSPFGCHHAGDLARLRIELQARGQSFRRKSHRRVPVAATVKRNGAFGRTPKTFAELIWGFRRLLGCEYIVFLRHIDDDPTRKNQVTRLEIEFPRFFIK